MAIEQDKLIAEALGWTEIEYLLTPQNKHIGRIPGGGPRSYLPVYSTCDAATLEGLKVLQNKYLLTPHIILMSGGGAELWFVNMDGKRIAWGMAEDTSDPAVQSDPIAAAFADAVTEPCTTQYETCDYLLESRRCKKGLCDKFTWRIKPALKEVLDDRP